MFQDEEKLDMYQMLLAFPMIPVLLDILDSLRYYLSVGGGSQLSQDIP